MSKCMSERQQVTQGVIAAWVVIDAGVVGGEFRRCLGLVCGVLCTPCSGSFDLIL